MNKSIFSLNSKKLIGGLKKSSVQSMNFFPSKSFTISKYTKKNRNSKVVPKITVDCQIFSLILIKFKTFPYRDSKGQVRILVSK